MRETTGRSLVRLIKSITSAGSSLLQAEQIQALVVKTGHAHSEYVTSALITLYATLGSLPSAHNLFDEIPHPGLVSWTATVRAYSVSNRPIQALQLFRSMIPAGLIPDPIALATAISACRRVHNPSAFKMIHAFIAKSGVEVDAFVGTEMIKGYGEFGEFESARLLFDEMTERNVVVYNAIIHVYGVHGAIEAAYLLFIEMPIRDVVSWNTVISAFSHVGRCREALALFREMESARARPNELTMRIVLSICSAVGALDTAMWIHAYVERNAMNLDGSLDHSLIDMYAKCGSIEKAVQVFEKVPVRRDLYSWTSVICGLAMHGKAERALCLFARMQDAGVEPDGVTFVGVLNACAHAGLVNEGCRYFRSMEVNYGLSPKVEHYGCMIDLLGRIGRLRKAYDLVLEMPMRPNAVVWGALLNACKVHNNVVLGETAATELVKLDPFDSWARLMLSNMYAEAYDWDGVMRLRKEMKGVGMRKAPGCSSIEVNGEVHEFLAGGSLHPKHQEINAMLKEIEAQM